MLSENKQVGTIGLEKNNLKECFAYDYNLVDRCLAGNEKAKKELYDKFAPKMFGICLRFARNKTEAEDILQEGFIKVFRNLKFFKKKGSLEGWIRKIIIHTAINYYKKEIKKAYQTIPLDVTHELSSKNNDSLSRLSVEELLNLIQELPTGYKTVFNLYAVEGYKHKEIAKILEISENTSKSQLIRARLMLQKKLEELEKGK